MSTLGAILLAGAGTYLGRAVFIIALARVRFGPVALRLLSQVAPAVLGALVVSFLTGSDGRLLVGVAEFLGLITAGLVAWRTRNHVTTLAAAMLVLWLVDWLH
jgi:branched-subunit amino acid transport protein